MDSIFKIAGCQHKAKARYTNKQDNLKGNSNVACRQQTAELHSSYYQAGM